MTTVDGKNLRRVEGARWTGSIPFEEATV
jgi:hypothetical protein